MEISARQSRAARALLGWTQKTLADKAGVALRTVQDFEARRRTPLNVVRATIKQTFEQNGIEFLSGDGVRFK
jgi:DNA-binding XRE family transcriptional regulator